MHLRQAKAALTRIAVIEALDDLVTAGVISQAVADAAATRCQVRSTRREPERYVVETCCGLGSLTQPGSATG
jgi:hypothetical protein